MSSDFLNELVKKKTKGKVTDLPAGLQPNAAALLVDVKVFNGKWKIPFGKNLTSTTKFFRQGLPDEFSWRGDTPYFDRPRESGEALLTSFGGEDDFLAEEEEVKKVEEERKLLRKFNGQKTVAVEMMCVEKAQFAISYNMEKGEYLVKMECKDGRTSMYLHLDRYKKVVCLQADLDRLRPLMSSQEVNLRVPKFNIDLKIDLLNAGRGKTKLGALAGLGYDLIHPKFELVDLIQILKVNMEEEGVSAVCISVGGDCFRGGSSRPLEVEFNQPFTALIVDDTTGAILFTIFYTGM